MQSTDYAAVVALLSKLGASKLPKLSEGLAALELHRAKHLRKDASREIKAALSGAFLPTIDGVVARPPPILPSS